MDGILSIDVDVYGDSTIEFDWFYYYQIDYAKIWIQDRSLIWISIKNDAFCGDFFSTIIDQKLNRVERILIALYNGNQSMPVRLFGKF